MPKQYQRGWQAQNRRMLRRASTLLGGAFLVLTGLTQRLVVEGPSMAPTLQDGDRVLAVRLRPAWLLPLRAGHIVAARDPRRPARIIVKRVVETGPEGTVVLAGDNPGQSTDSRQFGPLERSAVIGRVVYRYAPIAQRGLLTSNQPATRW